MLLLRADRNDIYLEQAVSVLHTREVVLLIATLMRLLTKFANAFVEPAPRLPSSVRDRLARHPKPAAGATTGESSDDAETVLPYSRLYRAKRWTGAFASTPIPRLAQVRYMLWQCPDDRPFMSVLYGYLTAFATSCLRSIIASAGYL